MADRAAPLHFMTYPPMDWLASTVRAAAIVEGDHVVRVVAIEGLFSLWTRGGFLPRHELGGACGVRKAEAERALAVLLEAGFFELDDAGHIFSAALIRFLEEAEQRRAAKRDAGARGGKERVANQTAAERSASAKAAARARWRRPVQRSSPSQDADQMRSHASHDANACERMRSSPTPTPTPTPTPRPTEQKARAGRAPEVSVGEFEQTDPEEVSRVVANLCERFPGLEPTPSVRSFVERLPRSEIDHAAEVTRAAQVDGIARSPGAYLAGVLREKVEERAHA